MSFTANNTNGDAKIRRKLNKPLVEKRRRERINKYLYELHGLLTEADNTTPTNKLEKADILEMAVNHIRNLKNKLRVRVIECGQDSMSLEQMNRLGLLQQDPSPVTQSLSVRIPSPASSSESGSTGYPSPTPSLPGTQATQQLLKLHNTMAILIPQQRIDNSHNMYMNTGNLYTTMPPQMYHQEESLVNHQAHRVTVTRRENVSKPQDMWRPW